MKTLGLIGGLTYHATALYYNQINAHVARTLGNGHSASLVLKSFDFADLTAHFRAGEQGRAEIARQLVEAGRNLKLSGAQALVLCVNTAHMFAEQIACDVGLEVLHIIDYAGAAIAERGLKKVALLGTRPVMDGSFIVGRLERNFGIEVLLPEPETRQVMNDLIFGELAENVVSEATKKLYVECVEGLVRQGAEGVVLACTELQFVLKEGDVSVPLFDTVELHARGVAEWMLRE